MDDELVIALLRILAHRHRMSISPCELRRKITTHKELSARKLVEKCESLDQLLRRSGVRFVVSQMGGCAVPWISKTERQENA